MQCIADSVPFPTLGMGRQLAVHMGAKCLVLLMISCPFFASSCTPGACKALLTEAWAGYQVD